MAPSLRSRRALAWREPLAREPSEGKMVVPVTRYAKSGDVHIAYQVFGGGATDLVFVPGFISHIENYWEHPDLARWLLRLGAFARVIMFDKRGTGLSDPVSVVPSLDLRMDDVRAVMDAAGSERAALLGVSEGGSLAALFAATYHQRCSQLVLYGAFARFPNAAEALKRFCSYADQAWGSGLSLSAWASSRQNDRTLQQWWGRFERLGASPAAAMAVTRMATETDVGDIVSSIRVPTLVIHSKELARYRGSEVKSLGDGFLATFDGPARAVRCACAIVEAVRPLEIQIRCGLHTGEIEMAGRDVEGIAVHIASRVSALAGAGEILVSRTVKDLVAGSGLHFEERGRHSLKGLLEPMELYAASH